MTHRFPSRLHDDNGVALEMSMMEIIMKMIQIEVIRAGGIGTKTFANPREE